MNKKLLLITAIVFSGNTFAATDHYVRRNGNHVQHLKITTIKDKITVTEDVDFEPNANETNSHSCSANISGEAKMEKENVLVMKQRSQIDANNCELTINLTPNGAIVEQSKDCDSFVTGICHFSSSGKEIIKVK